MKRLVCAVWVSLMATTTLAAEVAFTAHWTQIITTSSASATVEVVPSPLLSARHSPTAVADALWSSLSSLHADHAHYLAWFPYPRYTVGELAAGVWDMSLVLPMLQRFLDATAGHPAVVSFATQPAWCFTPAPPPVPSDADEPAWSYANGAPVATLTTAIEDYYAELWQRLVHNATLNITAWEIFNENEHEFLAETYPRIYDAIVSDVLNDSSSYSVQRPRFVALGGASPARLGSFLDAATTPVDVVSLHFRSTSHTRLRPADFEEFFDSAMYYAMFIESYVNPVLHNSRQQPALHINEAATLLPMDNDPGQLVPPALYWSASGGSFALLFALLTQCNVEAIAMAQLSGFPAIPEWNITRPFYPSLSMTDWTTGRPNARYWVLKLLVDNYPPGSTVVSITEDEYRPQTPFCANSDSRNGFPDITLECTDATATICAINFASFGTSQGVCGNFTNDTVCNSEGVFAFVERKCLGKHSCTVPVFPFSWVDNCEGFVESLRVQARCNKGAGLGTPRDNGDVFAAAFIDGRTRTHRVLLVNKRNEPAIVSLTSMDYTHGTITVVDDTTPATGPSKITLPTIKKIPLRPFATAFVELTKP